VASLTGRKRDGPHFIRTESGRVILPDEVGARIRNMSITEEATLRSVEGPCPYVPDYGPGYAAPDGGNHKGFSDYGTVYAIAHGTVRGRELLLLHVNDQIWVFQGWLRRWTVLLGPASSSPEYVTTGILNTSTPGIPTQFEFTPCGGGDLAPGESAILLRWGSRLTFRLRPNPLSPDGARTSVLGLPPKRPNGNYPVCFRSAYRRELLLRFGEQSGLRPR